MKKIDYSMLDKNCLTKYSEIFDKIRERVDEKLDGLKLNISLNSKNVTRKITFDYLLTAPFEELYLIEHGLSEWVKKYNTEKKIKNKKTKKPEIKTVNAFNDLFSYKKYQPLIAEFFMSKMNLSDICYYCNEQYISSFLDIQNDYIDAYDFLNHASEVELQLIKGIGDKTCEKIIGYRGINSKKFNCQKDLRNAYIMNLNLDSLWAQVKAMKTHNYFTLDHVLPQSDFPFFSLSLHNFVPCCYPCNSKFKRKINFEKDVIKSSPTSSKFIIKDSFQYRLLSNNKQLLNEDSINLSLLLDDSLLRAVPILEENFLNDSSLQNEYQNQKDLVNEYLRIFKLNGRYMNHKHHAITLANKRIKYSESQIEAIAKSLKISKDVVKKDVFGPAVINPNENVPLSKLYHDIAKQFKII